MLQALPKIISKFFNLNCSWDDTFNQVKQYNLKHSISAIKPGLTCQGLYGSASKCNMRKECSVGNSLNMKIIDIVCVPDTTLLTTWH